MKRKGARRRWAVAAVAVALAASAGFAVAYAVRCGEKGASGPPPPRDAGCETGPTTPGIDVSYHQDQINWRRVRQAGKLFAFIRVSDGTTVPDPLFGKNWPAAKHAGMLRGVYQYFRPEESPIAQADLMIDALGEDHGELPPVIDVETDGGKTPEQLALRIRTWVAHVRRRLGVEPIVYTGPDFWRDKAAGADFTAQPLWIAHYTQNCPTVPPPWRAWTFWQHSDAGDVPGIDGHVDLDVFAGTYTELEDFARRSRIPPVARAQ